MPTTNDVAKPETVALKVTVDNHTHAGKPCKKGDTIQVSKETAEMLEKVWTKTKKVAAK